MTSILYLALSLGTIGDLSDGESLSGQDNESLQDPTKKSHKRSMRKTAREDWTKQTNTQKNSNLHTKKR